MQNSPTQTYIVYMPENTRAIVSGSSMMKNKGPEFVDKC